MKKNLALLLALLLLCGLTACGKKGKETTDPADGTKSTDSTGSSSKATGSAAHNAFPTGLWEVLLDGEVVGYYYFSDTLTECSYHDAKTGNGIPFDYEIKGDAYIFHMGSADDASPVTVSDTGDGFFELKWMDRTEKIHFIQNETYDEFANDIAPVDPF